MTSTLIWLGIGYVGGRFGEVIVRWAIKKINEIRLSK